MSASVISMLPTTLVGKAKRLRFSGRGWRVTWCWWKPLGTGPTPIDACLGDRARLGPFTARWVALTVLMVASLPVLFVVGLAVLDGVLHAQG